MKHLSFGFLLACLTLTACRKQPTEAPPQTHGTTAAQTVAQKPEPALKLTFAVAPSEEPSPQAQANAKKLADIVAEKTGYAVDVMVPKSYAESITALRKKKAQVVFLSGWAFLKAHHSADGDLLLAEERDGKASYAAQWFVTKDSKIKKLADLKGKKVAFTSPTSAPGFLFPYAKLIEDGVVKQGEDLRKFFSEVYFTGAEQGAISALLEGKVDAATAADFAPAVYLSADDQAKLRPIASIDGVPTHVLAVRAEMDMDVKDKLRQVLISLNDEHKDLLESVYGVQKLIKRSHGDHMTPIQQAQELVGADYIMPAVPEEAPVAPKGLEEPAKPAAP